MEKVYPNSEDVNVKSVILYGKSADKYLYEDAEKTVKDALDRETVLDLALKGLLIVHYEGVYYPVKSFKDNTTNASVNIATDSADTTLYSKEYSE